MEKAFTIQEVAACTGLSVHALRYYERAGLLPSVKRAASGHRCYTADDLNWIAFLLRLRATGMSIRQMRAYAALRRQGDTTASARLALLEAHHRQVREQIRDLEQHLVAIEQKTHHLRSMVDDEMKGKEDE
jgi:DNA-binding transcriptional MerR regulator